MAPDFSKSKMNSGVRFLRGTGVAENVAVFVLEVVDVAVQLPDPVVVEGELFEEAVVVLRHDEVVVYLILLDQILELRIALIRLSLPTQLDPIRIIPPKILPFPTHKTTQNKITPSRIQA